MGRVAVAALGCVVAACVSAGHGAQATRAEKRPLVAAVEGGTLASSDAGHVTVADAGPAGCADDGTDCTMHPGVFVLSRTPTKDGTSCTATPEVRADGCEVWICET